MSLSPHDAIGVGTIFHDSKLPLTVWFQAIHLLTQGKHPVSAALELKWQLGVHDETAWGMKQKILQVIVEREEDRRLAGRVEVDEAYEGGERHEGKRGRGAEGKTSRAAIRNLGRRKVPKETTGVSLVGSPVLYRTNGSVRYVFLSSSEASNLLTRLVGTRLNGNKPFIFSSKR